MKKIIGNHMLYSLIFLCIINQHDLNAMKINNNNKPYICEKKSYKCLDCYKIFKSKDYCAQHIKRHTQNKFECDMYDKAYGRKSDLKKYREYHHPKIEHR